MKHTAWRARGRNRHAIGPHSHADWHSTCIYCVQARYNASWEQAAERHLADSISRPRHLMHSSHTLLAALPNTHVLFLIKSGICKPTIRTSHCRKAFSGVKRSRRSLIGVYGCTSNIIVGLYRHIRSRLLPGSQALWSHPRTFISSRCGRRRSGRDSCVVW